MTIEHRLAQEFRVAGRTLTGAAMRYGDVARGFRERFEPGAFGEVRSIDVNLQHDPDLVVVRGAMLTDGPRELRVRAELPEGSAVLSLVRRSAINGFSIEFLARAERREAGIRVIERAELTGLALVDRGAYPGARKPRSGSAPGSVCESSVPYDKALACECIAQMGSGSGGTCIPIARFSKAAGDEMAAMMARADNDVLAVAGNFKRPLGSVSRGTVRARSTDDSLEIEIDLPAGAVGEEMIAANETAGVIIRPLIDPTRSEFIDTDRGREYSKPHLRAFIVGSTDTKAGWPDVTIEDVLEDAPTPTAQKRVRLWL